MTLARLGVAFASLCISHKMSAAAGSEVWSFMAKNHTAFPNGGKQVKCYRTYQRHLYDEVAVAVSIEMAHEDTRTGESHTWARPRGSGGSQNFARVVNKDDDKSYCSVRIRICHAEDYRNARKGQLDITLIVHFSRIDTHPDGSRISSEMAFGKAASSVDVDNYAMSPGTHNRVPHEKAPAVCV